MNQVRGVRVHYLIKDPEHKYSTRDKEAGFMDMDETDYKKSASYLAKIADITLTEPIQPIIDTDGSRQWGVI